MTPRESYDARRLGEASPGPWTPAELGRRIGLTRRGARILLERARARGWATQQANGRWSLHPPPPQGPTSVYDALDRALEPGRWFTTSELVERCAPYARSTLIDALGQLVRCGGVERVSRFGRERQWCLAS